MNILTGTKFDETIFGGRDDDLISAWAGNDVVYGGAGNDVIFDWLYRAGRVNGADTYYGGVGNDLLYTVGGADRLFGGRGADMFIFANSDSDVRINGGRGRDELIMDCVDAPEVLDHQGNRWTLAIGDQIVEVRSVESIHASDDSWAL